MEFFQKDKSITAAKIAASKKFNKERNVVDTFTYICDNGDFCKFNRINKKYPNGNIFFGQWK
jgi:hypothetical protein